VKVRVFFRRDGIDRNGHLRGLYRALAENRKLLQDNFKVVVFLNQPDHVAISAFAVAAVVVEELNECHRTLRISENNLACRVEQYVGAVIERLETCSLLGLLFAALQLIKRLGDDFRIFQQVLANDFLNVIAAEVLCNGRCSKQRNYQDRGEQDAQMSGRSHAMQECK